MKKLEIDEEKRAKIAEKRKNAKKKIHPIIKEFTEFINRGNVVDMAVGVVIGTAFSAIVTSLVNDIIMPLVGLLIGGVDFSGLSITIPNLFGLTDAAVIAYGNFIQNIVNFLIIALCVFFFVRFFNKLTTLRKSAAEEAKETKEAAAKEAKREAGSDTEMLEVLKDIRAELKKNNKK